MTALKYDTKVTKDTKKKNQKWIEFEHIAARERSK
jgi:hypothetical protein